MKCLSAIFLLIFSLNVFAQKTDDVLATANGQSFTLLDIAPEARQALENLPPRLKEARSALLAQQINDALFEQEAAARNLTTEKLVETEIRTKTNAPTEAEINAVYEANRNNIGGQTLEQIRPQIVAFLKRDAEQKRRADFISGLKAKYKVVLLKDVNAANLTTFENLATVGSQTISVKLFEAKNKARLADIEGEVYEFVRDNLEEIVYSNLLVAEAKAENVDAGTFIVREINGKMKTDSETERAALESALRERLFTKYNAKFFIKDVPPVVEKISTENQPSRGKINAPVTVVMFTDFQCPACSATHPVLREVLNGYADKIRFVVRDYPLVEIHENAFRAAEAAAVANAQGKFFEYTELLYQNQTQFDDKSLIAYAAQVGLDAKRFEADLKSGKFAAEIQRDMSDGRALNLAGTPSVFVNGVKVRTLSADGFRRAINRALKK